MKYLLIFIMWLLVCAVRFIWEFKTIPFKDFIEKEKDSDHMDLIF